MSIATSLSRIVTLRNTIREKLAAMGLVSAGAKLEDCKTAIVGITDNTKKTTTSNAVSGTYYSGTTGKIYGRPGAGYCAAGTVVSIPVTNLAAENIKKGVNVGGVVGTYFNTLELNRAIGEYRMSYTGYYQQSSTTLRSYPIYVGVGTNFIMEINGLRGGIANLRIIKMGDSVTAHVLYTSKRGTGSSSGYADVHTFMDITSRVNTDAKTINLEGLVVRAASSVSGYSGHNFHGVISYSDSSITIPCQLYSNGSNDTSTTCYMTITSN